MKNRSNALLLCAAMLFFGFMIGLFVGRNQNREAVLISLPPQMMTAPVVTTEPQLAIQFPIDINSADEESFLALPNVGEKLAFRILSYRRDRGKFKSISDLLKVEGMTEDILAEIEDLIYVGG